MRDLKATEIHLRIKSAIDKGNYWKLNDIEHLLHDLTDQMKPFKTRYKPYWIRRQYIDELNLVIDLLLTESDSERLKILIDNEIKRGAECDTAAVERWKEALNLFIVTGYK